MIRYFFRSARWAARSLALVSGFADRLPRDPRLSWLFLAFISASSSSTSPSVLAPYSSSAELSTDSSSSADDIASNPVGRSVEALSLEKFVVPYFRRWGLDMIGGTSSGNVMNRKCGSVVPKNAPSTAWYLGYSIHGVRLWHLSVRVRGI